MSHSLVRISKGLVTLLLAFCILFVSLLTSGQAISWQRPAAPAETIINTDITTDTTWTLANSPYHITVADLDIMPGATLTIEPGVQIWVDPKLHIHVWDGASLIAKGTPSQHIVFDRYTDPVTGERKRWKKIWFHGSSSSYLRYVEVLGAGADSSDENASLHYQGTGTHVLNMCQIRDGDQFGLVAEGNAHLTIAGSLFTDNIKVDLVVGENASVVVTGSSLDKRAVGKGRTVWRRVGTSSLRINNSNIWTPAGEYGVQNDAPGSFCIDAQNNWWGAASGPYDASGAGDACGLGSNGGSGSWVTNGVDYRNWRTTEATRVGITTAPTATFTVSPNPAIPRPPGTVYTFDASGSSDAEDYTSSLEVCWDWDNDGTCDTSWAKTKTANHSFATGGLHTVCLVVRDTDAMTATATQDILSGYPPTATFTFTPTTWAQVDFDASGSTDVETPQSQLEALWDWEGDDVWDTGVVSVTQVQSHTYPHLGRYWPTLQVEDADGITDTARQAVDIIPPTASQIITGSGGTLVSVDGTVQVGVYTDTVGGDLISNGLVITHTPWLTVPHGALLGDFTYQGFTLSARSLADGQPIEEVNGTYTITLFYDYDYFTDVLDLLPFEKRLTLYQWVPATGSWEPVPATLDTANDQLVATPSAFGDFALVMDIKRVYLPLILRSN